MLAFPNGTKAVIDQIRGLIGRDITITVEEGRTACTVSGCSLDPVTEFSTNSFCSGCHGEYWIPVYSGYSVSGHVRWGYADQPYHTAGGIIPEGDCKVTIELTAENLDHVKRSEYWTVDDITLYMKKFQLKGVRTTLESHGSNRIAVYLKEEER